MGIAEAGTPGAAADAALVTALAEPNRALSVPTPGDYGLDLARWTGLLPVMAEQALASGSPANNPRVSGAAELVSLYRAMWDGQRPPALLSRPSGRMCRYRALLERPPIRPYPDRSSG